MTEFYMGTIVPMAFSFAPRGWMSCEGQLISIQQNQALFALLGTTFGGNGVQTFGLPDLRGRRVIGQGVSPSLGTWTWGQKGGVENTTILLNQMPTHQHAVTVKANQIASESNDPQNNYLGGGATANYTATAPDVQFNVAESTAGIAGGSQPVNIQTPYLAMYYNICTQGLFPSRN